MNKQFDLTQFINAIPKIELHIHLEGSIPSELLYEFARRANDPGINTMEDIYKKLDYNNFSDFVEVWKWKNTLIQNPDDLEKIAYYALRKLHSMNVKYAELFYSPGDFAYKGWTLEEITESWIKGKERAYKDFNVKSELIMDLVRDFGPENGMNWLDEVTPYLGKGVIGIGLGGSEYMFPPKPYELIYREAKERGFRLVAHAGETAGADCIKETIEYLSAERIGHGTRLYEDPQLLELIINKKIPLEISLLSNIKLGVCESVEKHPVKQYFNEGVLVTINSDDPGMFNTSINDEYMALIRKLNFSLHDIRTITMNSITASFMSPDDKKLMEDMFEKEWNDLLMKYDVD